MSFHLNFDDLLKNHFQNNKAQKLSITSANPNFAAALISSQSLHLSSKEQPALIITENLEAAQKLKETINLFKKFQSNRLPGDAFVLPAHDISPYSGLYSSRRLSQQRIQWFHRALFPEIGDLFIAPLKALAQYTLPTEVLIDNSHQYETGQSLPDHLPSFLSRMGYISAPVAEDSGTFSVRGGIVDIYSPAHKHPVRIELFGDQIESLRTFSPETQRSLEEIHQFSLIPAQEILFDEHRIIRCCKKLEGLESEEDITAIQAQLRSEQYFEGIEFFLPYIYDQQTLPIDYFSLPPKSFWLGAVDVETGFTTEFSALNEEYDQLRTHLPSPQELYLKPTPLNSKLSSDRIDIESLDILDEIGTEQVSFESQTILPSNASTYAERLQQLIEKVKDWRKDRNSVFLFGPSENQFKKIKNAFDTVNLDLKLITEPSGENAWDQLVDEQENKKILVHFIKHPLGTSFHASGEKLVFVDVEKYLKKTESKSSAIKSAISKAQALSFSELKEGDPVVHALHGVAIYLGLKVMNITGVDAEYLELMFKGKDKLFLPIYRLNQVHKYTGAGKVPTLDKLGGKGWLKTKAKVQKRLREIADELVKLYAARKFTKRAPFDVDHDDIQSFISAFPYPDTVDQAKTIGDLMEDLSDSKPMDRLICGDVGFGKTEMAMRAAFIVASQKKQVAVLAPTTILTFQHVENFKKRFKDWPLNIKVLNRFIPKAEIKKTVEEIKSGEIDIIIGTHRLLSQDISYKDLGLLIIDEEQKFGVKHKEKLRQIKNQVDTLAMSATPIPRTLNMSLLGIRDLSLINTAPHDRLPTRTFVCKFDMGVIKKATLSEIKRGGQVFFLHNRVQSIYALADELRHSMPNVRMAVAHGQMDEKELEKTIVAFFNKEIDMLICTTIIESGMDIPNANTMFVDKANTLGLSQLYQLRGRVGRSKQRAFCYLLIPRQGKIDDVAQERLRILQQNTALGSGIRIAQYDLELRGAGTILGEEQSGTVDAIGYEMYMDLLEQAVQEAKGETVDPRIEPEINLKVRALIPHQYMPDIRLRLSYYKALSSIEVETDLDQIEEDLRDQFGQPPEEVFNLMGLMMIRHTCKELGIRDVSAGAATVSLAFTENTKLPVEKVVELTLMPNKKYVLTPDSRLKIRMKEITWQNIYEELNHLRRLL